MIDSIFGGREMHRWMKAVYGHSLCRSSVTDGHSIGFLCKAVSTSVIFVFTMNALPDRFQSSTDPVQRNRCTELVIEGAFGAVSLGYFC
ncbi:hypothetical protein TNCV_1459711 [Trichonephila clavipes]|nr:hypothetical protein TNCV_1459711 [Trichonephila clavipes]